MEQGTFGKPALRTQEVHFRAIWWSLAYVDAKYLFFLICTIYIRGLLLYLAILSHLSSIYNSV